MQFLYSLSAALLLTVASAQGQSLFSNDPIEVEHLHVTVSAFYQAIAVTSASHRGNYLNEYTQPICVADITQVREAVVNGTRDMFIEVTGCAVLTPQGACGTDECQRVPFELNVIGAEATPGFDPVTAQRLGKPVETPYKIRSIGVLL